MAEHSHEAGMDMSAHIQAYEGFLRGSVALVILVGYTLVALCSFAFGSSGSLFLGFAGLILGTLAVIVDLRSGTKRWMLSGGLLVIFALLTAINVA